MATTSRRTKAARRSSQNRVTVERGESRESSSDNFLDKIQNDLEKNQSYLNLVLGALIVIVLGVLIYNYFNRSTEQPGDLGPAQEQMTDSTGDVTKEGLPGTYTVKEGDTLFTIAQKYYDNGDLYTEIIRENNLETDAIEVGQSLIIPKVEGLAEASPSPDSSTKPMAGASASPEASPSPEAMAQASAAPAATPAATANEFGKGGAENQTIWGESIKGDSYTVTQGDWLSKISGRAYGDIMQYGKIAQANNIADPNVIEIGTVLKIPR